MTHPERKNPSSISMGGSEPALRLPKWQTFCGSCGLPDWQKQVGFVHIGNMKLACYAENWPQLVWTIPGFCSDKQVAGIAVAHAKSRLMLRRSCPLLPCKRAIGQPFAF